jgi:hypothetical protein
MRRVDAHTVLVADAAFGTIGDSDIGEPMFRVTVEVTEPHLIDAYVAQLEQAPDVVNKLVNEAVNADGDKLLDALRQEPGPVVLPIKWKSDKQRKAYFASKGFGRGIPFHRATAPNRIVDRWKMVVVYEPGALTAVVLENDSPARRYVTGSDQQPFHRITGWHDDDVIIAGGQARMVDSVETALIKGFYAIERQA